MGSESSLSGLEDLFYLAIPLSRICGSKRTNMMNLAQPLCTESASKLVVEEEFKHCFAKEDVFSKGLDTGAPLLPSGYPSTAFLGALVTRTTVCRTVLIYSNVIGNAMFSKKKKKKKKK